jgi:hypothetical protein
MNAADAVARYQKYAGRPRACAPCQRLLSMPIDFFDVPAPGVNMLSLALTLGSPPRPAPRLPARRADGAGDLRAERDTR